MDYLSQLKQKNIIVLGLGISGLSTVRFLLQQNIQPKVVDSRKNAPGRDWLTDNAAELSVHFGELSQADLSQADLIIISPGIALAQNDVQQAIEAGVEIIGDIELFARLSDKPVVAVTGSNGKSSVVTLAAEVLSEAGFNVALGGNIGTPILDLLAQDLSSDNPFEVYVLELSSFQLETTTSLKPIAATILNISEDHLDRYPDMAAYIQAKQRIYHHCLYAVYNQDDIHTYPRNAQNQLSFAPIRADFCLVSDNGKLAFSAMDKLVCTTDTLKIEGLHNQLNVLAVMALLSPWRLPEQVFIKALTHFSGLAHRCQLVANINGVKYFNDSKATNVGACIAAINSLGGEKNIILIAGGDGKGADFSPLKPYLQQYVKQLIAIGKDAPAMMALTDNALQADSMLQAVQLAKQTSQSGDIVLLAPACASLDMYANFVARGNDFTACVQTLIDPEKASGAS